MTVRRIQLEDFKKMYAFAYSECLISESKADESRVRVLEAETSLRKLVSSVTSNMQKEAESLYSAVFVSRSDKYYWMLKNELEKTARESVDEMIKHTGAKAYDILASVEESIDMRLRTIDTFDELLNGTDGVAARLNVRMKEDASKFSGCLEERLLGDAGIAIRLGAKLRKSTGDLESSISRAANSVESLTSGLQNLKILAGALSATFGVGIITGALIAKVVAY